MNKSTLFKMIVMLLIFSVFQNAKAQTSITSSDFTAQLQIGKQVSTYLDRTTSQVNVGVTGETSWDFSNLVVDDEFVTESKQHAVSPYVADFPNAMFTSNYEGVFEGNYSNTWVYNTVNTSFLTHGTGTVANTQVGNIKTVIKYNPAWEQYRFPVQYLDSKTFVGKQLVTTFVNIPGIGEFPNTIEQDVTIEQNIDAYGIVIMPNGKRLNALRLVETTTFNNSGTVSTTTVIRLLTKTGESVSITPQNSQSLNGIIQIQNISWTSGDGESITEVIIYSPTGLSATVGESTIELSWADQSDNETGFVLERMESGGAFEVLSNLSANTTSYTDSDVEAGVTYTYRVKAVGAESESDYSNTVTGTVEALPEQVSAPSGLSATVGESTIELSWADQSDNETGFVLERMESGGAFEVLSNMSANTTSYTDSNVEAGVTYTYRVKAVGAESESDYSNTVTGTVEALPEQVSAPSGLSATVGESTIELSWADQSDNETGFVLERMESGGAFAVLSSLSANTTLYTDSNVEAGVTYTYRVKAVGVESESDYSNTVTGTVDALPEQVAAPTGLSATVGESTIELSWADQSDNETGFVLERMESGGAFAVLSSLSANTTLYTDSNVEAGVTYTYRVKAVGVESESDYSNTVTGTVDALPEQVAAPTGLSATVGESTIELSWADQSDNETGFVLERMESGGAFAVLSSLSANTTSYTDSNVEAGVTYTYRVKAVGAESESDYSNTVTGTVEALPEQVSAPTDLSATVGESTIELSWADQSDNETGFVLERMESEGVFEVLASSSANTTSYTDSYVEAGITYTYRVKAVGAESESDYSNTVTAMLEQVNGIDNKTQSSYKSLNYPNPFKAYTTFKFSLNKSTITIFKVYNIHGKLIHTWTQWFEKGANESIFDGSELQSGLYFYKIQAEGQQFEGRMLIE